MVFSTINHHNHNNHSVAGLGFYWVSIGCCVMCCCPSKWWRFDVMACGVGFDLLLSGLSFILICKLGNSSPLYWVSSLKTGEKNCLHQEDDEKVTYSECWLGPGQRLSWLMFFPAGCGSPPVSPPGTLRHLGLTTSPAVGCVTAPSSG